MGTAYVFKNVCKHIIIIIIITRSLLPVLQLDWEPQLGEGPLPSDWMPIFQRTNSWQTPRLRIRLQRRHQTGWFFGGWLPGYLKSFDKFVLQFLIPRPHLSRGSKSGFVLLSVMNFLESQPCFERKQLEALWQSGMCWSSFACGKHKIGWSSKNPGISDMYWNLNLIPWIKNLAKPMVWEGKTLKSVCLCRF